MSKKIELGIAPLLSLYIHTQKMLYNNHNLVYLIIFSIYQDKKMSSGKGTQRCTSKCQPFSFVFNLLVTLYIVLCVLVDSHYFESNSFSYFNGVKFSLWCILRIIKVQKMYIMIHVGIIMLHFVFTYCIVGYM
jgi:hypothetical protein